MSQGPYSSYHGRKRPLRSILIGVAAALVVVLLAVLAGYYFGLIDVPGGAGGTADVSDGPDGGAVSDETVDPSQAPSVIIDTPGTGTGVGSTATTTPGAEVDLSDCVIRDIPLGLVLTEMDALPETSNHGVLVDMTEVDLAELDDDFSDTLAGYPYAAAWLAPDWETIGEDGFQSALTDRCAALAALGFDEIVFNAADPAKVDGDALAEVYTDLREALTDAGWQGRLGLDVDQGWFKADSEAIVPTMAESFERLYFRKTLTDGNKRALTNNGFVATGRTIVTYTKSVANLSYAWAVLP